MFKIWFAVRGWWDNDGWQPRQLRRWGRMLWSCSGILRHVSPFLLLQPFSCSHTRLSSFCLLFPIHIFPNREASQGLPEWINVEVSCVIIWFSAITTKSNDDMYLDKSKRWDVFKLGKSKRYWTTLDKVRHGCEKNLTQQFSDGIQEFICKRWQCYSFHLYLCRR